MPATAHMFIINPLTGQGMDNLFSAHPNTENRIAALEALAREIGPLPSALSGGGSAATPSAAAAAACRARTARGRAGQWGEDPTAAPGAEPRTACNRAVMIHASA